MTLRMFVITGAVCAAAVTAAAQTAPAVDNRWSAWLGCWDLQTESRSQGDLDPAAASRAAAPNVRPAPARVCVTPADSPDAVRLQTTVNGETLLDELVSGNGADVAISEDTCHGTRAAAWSLDGRLLFTRGTLQCDGQPTRTVSGLMMLVPGPTWVDVQLIAVADRRSMRVRRYGLAGGQIQTAGHAAPMSVAPALVDRLTIEEVMEAARKVEPEVVQAAVIEVGAGFPLDTGRLIELEKAGVPDSIVDVMVALTFPERFEIQHAAPPPRAAPTVIWYDPWALPSPLGRRVVYAPFGYQYFGYYDPYYGRGWGWAPVARARVVPMAPPRPPLVVNTRGYTRATPPRTARPVASDSESTKPAAARPGSGNTSVGSSDAATVSPSGYSRGSSASAPAAPRGYTSGGASSSSSAGRSSGSGSSSSGASASSGSSSGSSGKSGGTSSASSGGYSRGGASSGASAGRSSGGGASSRGSSGSSGRTAKPRPPGH